MGKWNTRFISAPNFWWFGLVWFGWFWFGFVGLGLVSFRWVGFYGISSTVGHLKPNPLYTCVLNIYDFVWLSRIACQLLEDISCKILFIYIYIYTWFGLIWFNVMSTIACYLMPNLLLYINIKYVWFLNTLLNNIFKLATQLNGFTFSI